MIILFLLLLVPATFYSMTHFHDQERQEVGIENNYQECKRALQTSDQFIPGSIFMRQLMLHSAGPDLAKQIAAQDAIWLERADHLHDMLVQMIRNCSYPIAKGLIAESLEIFLTAGKQKGHSNFVNRTTLKSNDTILEASIAAKNAECALVALQHNAKTRN